MQCLCCISAEYRPAPLSHTRRPSPLPFHLQVSSDMGVWKLTEESHLVTIASPHEHKPFPPCWGPSVGVFRALCRWCHCNAPWSTQLIGEAWWADSWVGVLHKMFCLSLFSLQGDERPEPPTELLCPLPEGTYQPWKIMSCSFYGLT